MTAGTATPATTEARRLTRWVLPLAALAQLMLALDFAIVNVALSTIQSELGFDSAGLQWVATAYALTFGAFLMIGGRLGDRFGMRRILLVGISVFGLASLTGGLALTAPLLVVSRFVQGAGAALVAPTAFALVAGLYADPASRARAISLFQGSNALGGLAGVLLGGLLTATVGWRWVLLINPPVVLALGVLVLLRIPKSMGTERTPGTTGDAGGAVALSLGIAALIFGVSRLEQAGPRSPEVWAPLLGAAVAVPIFVVIERRSAQPILPGSLLGRRRWTVLVATLVLGGAMSAYAYFLALYLQRVLHFPAGVAALAFLPATVTGLLASTQLAPRVLPRVGARAGLVIALGVLGAGQLWLARLPADGDYRIDVLVGVIPIAVGLGLAFPAAGILLTDRVPEKQSGVAGALLAMGLQVGAAIGLAVLATVAALPAGGATIAYDAVFLVSAAAVIAAAVLVAAAGPRSRI